MKFTKVPDLSLFVLKLKQCFEIFLPVIRQKFTNFAKNKKFACYFLSENFETSQIKTNHATSTACKIVNENC